MELLFNPASIFSNCNEVLCSPLNPSLIDATGLVTDQYIAERKLSQLQAEMQQQVPAGQIGVLMQPQSRPGDQNNIPDSKFAAYPRQPQPTAVIQNSAHSISHIEPAKLNLPNNERTSRDGMYIIFENQQAHLIRRY